MEISGMKKCCICGKMAPAYHNPDPVRDGAQDCCDACNRLVISARRKYSDLPGDEYKACVQRLHNMTYQELVEELKETTDD